MAETSIEDVRVQVEVLATRTGDYRKATDTQLIAISGTVEKICDEIVGNGREGIRPAVRRIDRTQKRFLWALVVVCGSALAALGKWLFENLAN